MRYGSVCSGIEAATMAWHKLGWKPVFFSEIDKFPSAVLAHHYGSNMPGEPVTGNGVPNYGDMTQFEGWPEHAIDILVGGTPCQDYSIAGLRKGMEGDRGSLTLTYIEITARYRPRWIVWENVPGVLSSNSGKDFARFLGDISGTKIKVPKCGWKNSGIVAGDPNAYGLAYRVLDTQYVRTCDHPRAIPQRRRRVFVVGYLGDWRNAAAVLLNPESMRRDLKPSRKAGKGFAVGTIRSTDGGCDVDHARARHLIPEVTHTLKAEGFDASEDGTGRGTPIIPTVANPLTARMHRGINTTCDEGQTPLPIVTQPIVMAERGRAGGQTLETRQDGSMNTILTPSGGRGGLGVGAIAHPVALSFAQNQRGELRTSDVSTSLNVGGGKPGEGYPAVMENSGKSEQWAVRRLTPIECERLQGFPDDFTRIPWGKKTADDCPDGHRYKALGNSMSTNVMEWIGRQIEFVEGIIKDA